MKAKELINDIQDNNRFMQEYLKHLPESALTRNITKHNEETLKQIQQYKKYKSETGKRRKEKFFQIIKGIANTIKIIYQWLQEEKKEESEEINTTEKKE